MSVRAGSQLFVDQSTLLRAKKFDLQQFEVPRHLIDLRRIIGPNGEACARRLAVEFGSAAVCNQVNLKRRRDGFVVNGHQFLFAVAAHAYLRKRSQNPGLHVWGKIIHPN